MVKERSFADIGQTFAERNVLYFNRTVRPTEQVEARVGNYVKSVRLAGVDEKLHVVKPFATREQTRADKVFFLSYRLIALRTLYLAARFGIDLSFEVTTGIENDFGNPLTTAIIKRPLRTARL